MNAEEFHARVYDVVVTRLDADAVGAKK